MFSLKYTASKLESAGIDNSCVTLNNLATPTTLTAFRDVSSLQHPTSEGNAPTFFPLHLADY